MDAREEHEERRDLGRWITPAETVIYVATGVLLTAAAVAMLGTAAWGFIGDLSHADVGEGALRMLDQLLLVLMLAELLYTVRVSLRTHALVPEPFLIVGLIAGVRRVLIITAEAWHLGQTDPDQFRMAMIELGLLTGMILATVVSVILLRRFRGAGLDTRSGE